MKNTWKILSVKRTKKFCAQCDEEDKGYNKGGKAEFLIAQIALIANDCRLIAKDCFDCNQLFPPWVTTVNDVTKCLVVRKRKPDSDSYA
jgi:hypothetical protein